MANHKKTYRFVYLHGDTIVTDDLKAFCREHSPPLKYASMSAVARGATKEHQGYTVASTHDTTPNAKHTAPMMLFNRGLRLHTEFSNNRSTLAAQSGISVQSIWRMMTGKASNVRGWEIAEDEFDLPSDIEFNAKWQPATPQPKTEPDYLPGEEDL